MHLQMRIMPVVVPSAKVAAGYIKLSGAYLRIVRPVGSFVDTAIGFGNCESGRIEWIQFSVY